MNTFVYSFLNALNQTCADLLKIDMYTTIMYICTHFKIPAYVFMSTIYKYVYRDYMIYMFLQCTANVKRKKNGYLQNVSMPKSCSYK